MTEIISPEPCLPQICLVKDCLKAVVNETNYSVGVECNKTDGVSVNLTIAEPQINPNKRKKYGACSTGRHIIATLYIEIFVAKCSEQSCAAVVASEAIKNKICTCDCCVDVSWIKAENEELPKDGEETWVDIYSISYFDPQAK